MFILNNKKYDNIKQEKTIIESKHLSLKENWSLFLKIFKNDRIRLLIYSLIVASLIVVLGLCELITNFEASKIMKKELENFEQDSIYLSKTEIKDSNIEIDYGRIINIEKEEIEKFYVNGYNGNIYELVNLSLDFGISTTLSHDHRKVSFSTKDFYYTQTTGVLVTTEEYMKKIFGDIVYLAKAEKQEDSGVYITDYAADAIMYYSPKNFRSYQEIVGKYAPYKANYYAYINGIIKTDYKEKYSEIIETLKNTDINQNEVLELASSKIYQQYYTDVIQNLAIAYTTNSNFVNDLVETGFKTWCPGGKSIFVKDNVEYISEVRYFENATYRSKIKLNDNEIIMDYSTYNKIFNTDYTLNNYNNFESQDVRFKYCYFYDVDSNKPVYQFDVKIVGLTNETNYISNNLFEMMLETELFTSGIYFDNLDNVTNILDTANELGFSTNSIIAASLNTMTKAVSVFSDFFLLIFIALCVCSLVVCANYGIKLVKEKKYEIGILKSIGIRNVDLEIMFGLQMGFMLIFVVAFYIIGSFLFINLANDVLVRSLSELAPSHTIIKMEFLVINNKDLLINSLIVLVIIFASFIIPLMRLKKFKPTEIIKAKE